jgi:simple sugar transport system ATP-binding protein
MVGRPVGFQPAKAKVEAGMPRLRLEGVRALSDMEHEALRGISLEVRSGEIVGLAGVSGNGQRELAEVAAGLRPTTAGRIFVGELDVTGKSPRAIMDCGLSYIPEERMRDGMIREFTVAENVILREHDQTPYARGIFLNRNAINSRSAELVEAYNCKTPSLETPVKNLSGGNIQKIILAREISRRPQVIIAAQPTRGLDIGATEYVHARLLEQREAGMATLLISEDLDEILALADRIIVIYEGQVMGEVARADATAEKLGLMMAGVGVTAAA